MVLILLLISQRWTNGHIKKRLRWAHKHVNWTVEQWSSVIWSDESWFTVTGNDGGARIIRKVDKRYEAKHIVPTKKYGGGEVMIWSCFHANGFGPLVLVDGTVYQDKIYQYFSSKLPYLIHTTLPARGQSLHIPKG